MPGEKNSKTIAPATVLPASTSGLIALGCIARQTFGVKKSAGVISRFSCVSSAPSLALSAT